MNSSKHWLLTIILLFTLFQVHSQTTNNVQKTQISGKLIDQNKNEVVYASITLILNDSTPVNRTISSITGDYTISNVNPGNYKIKVSHLEYKTYSSERFTISKSNRNIIKNITLKPTENTLGEIVITQKKALVEIKPNKLIFNVSSSPSASGTNGLDLLSQTPGVTLDMNNNISLLGKSNVQIYLNGVQSRLSGTDLTSFLQSLTSDIIDSIEIISNPPAKYSAEGTGGIINIRMKKNVSTGFNGSIASSFTKGIEYRYNNSLSVNFGNEKIKTNIDFTNTHNNYLVRFDDEKQQNNSTLLLDSKENKIKGGFNLGFAIEAQISNNQSLSIEARSILNNNDNSLNSTTDIYQTNPSEFSEILFSQSFLEGNSKNHLANLNHFWNTSGTSTLVTNISLGNYSSENKTEQPNTYFEPDGTTIKSKEDTTFKADTEINLWSIKTDYEKDWQNLSFSTGLKYSWVISKNDFTFFNIENEIPIFDSSKSNDFNYTENVAAIYANLNIKFNTVLSFNAGIRVENTVSRGKLTSEIDIDNKDVTRNYTNFFPNIGLSFDDQKKHNLSLNIGRRITRPNYQDLNPFETPTSQLVIWKGNPFLRPNYIMNYQLSYSYNQKLILTGFYSNTTDFFSRIIEVIGENRSQFIPRNLQSSINYGLSLSYTMTINKYWEAVIFGNLNRKTFDGELEGETIINLGATLWDYRIQNNINLPHDILLDINFTQRSKWIWRGSSYIKGTHSWNFGVRKNLFNEKLQIRITGSDILRTTSDYPYYLNYGGLGLNGVYTHDGRRFGLGITYKFGNQKAKNKRKTNSALDDELNRIEK
ncbi:outer membrane beta-barrel family protein [Seonamhaeicola maritimus]|uniref:outer membrane beta-barrel family protein n=1 Tax=Seonamhaeicola maritimus TaxID=2591822 RepID=UPI002494F225|nr:outer membrane beta-barrel family protein [Seonamhaeicola maritimus]